ncbi:MAG: pentapeptide repeat-containing protein [Verrucomicrobiae bacterium]|nr:pentapeptide repeat-containing protein [Verrucomicrobiae bacterium]
MPQRLSYEDSCRALQAAQIIAAGAIPPAPYQRPRHDDEVPGVSIFRTVLTKAKLERLTLPRTFFGRSEIRATSFQDTDLSESTANWNDFIEVDFTGADLSGSDLRACVFERVRFRGANLTGVDFRCCGFKKCDFTDANLTDAKLTQKVGAALKLSEEQQSVVDWHGEDGEEPAGG